MRLETSLMLAVLLLASCKELGDGSEVMGGSPLPIRGAFLMTHFKGHVNVGPGGQLSAGTSKPMMFEKNFANTESSKVEFDIDSEGKGRITAWQRCQASGLKPSNGKPGENETDLSVVEKLNLIYALWNMLNTTKSDINCAIDPEKLGKDTIRTFRNSNFFGFSDPRLPKNLGVMGEESDIHASEKECSAMRGVRYITLNDARACIGFTNGAATKVKMLLLRPGEINVQRIEFVRD